MHRRICILTLLLAYAIEMYARRQSAFRSKAKEQLNDDTYSYVVCLLDNSWARECTGTLIKSRWVLTAAHCMFGAEITHVQYGNMSIHPRLTKTKSLVIKKIPHPNFRFGESLIDDIGLLYVKEVPVREFPKILGKNYHRLLGDRVEYTGFVPLHIDPEKQPVWTRPLRIYHGIAKSCRDVREVRLRKHFLCIVSDAKVSSDMRFAEDSGGPLLWQGRIVGVTSWGSADGTIPDGVYTPLGPYRAWILNTIKSGGKTKRNPIVKRLC